MSWGEGLTSWISEGSIGASQLEARDRIRERKEAQDNAALQRSIEYQRQMEFAKNGLRWKVEDAKAAGLHPLAAIGGTGSLYAPASTTVFGGSGETGYAGAFANAGQNIMRAVNATRTAPEREAAQIQTQQQLQMNSLEMEGKQLQNDLVRSQLAQQNSMRNPPFPGTVSKPAEMTMTAPGKPDQEAGQVSDLGWARTATGVYPVPSKDVKERIEDNMIQETGWAFRNNLMPNLGAGSLPPANLLPKGATGWEWSYRNQEYQPSFKKYPWDYRTDGR